MTVCADVESAAVKLVLLKSNFPAADVLRVITQRPKLLLTPPEKLEEDLAKVQCVRACVLGVVRCASHSGG